MLDATAANLEIEMRALLSLGGGCHGLYICVDDRRIRGMFDGREIPAMWCGREGCWLRLANGDTGGEGNLGHRSGSSEPGRALYAVKNRKELLLWGGWRPGRGNVVRLREVWEHGSSKSQVQRRAGWDSG